VPSWEQVLAGERVEELVEWVVDNGDVANVVADSYSSAGGGAIVDAPKI
jgi:hypothetical protein